MGAIILASDEGGFGMEAAVAAFNRTGSRFDALEEGIRAVEDDLRARTVGFGGAPNAEGVMELDASFMDGTTRMCGAVGALRETRYPIKVARRVMEDLPHVFLVGNGAQRFAREMGAEARDMLAPESRDDFVEWMASHQMTPERLAMEPLRPLMDYTPKRDLSFGTVTFVMRDDAGRFAGGVSTSGWAYKYPGRLGDSPVIGAGLYVDDRYGACACTHTGEMTIRATTAHSVVMHMRYGKSVQEACHLAAEDLLSLSGGYLGPVILHALDRDGIPYVLRVGDTDGNRAWCWKADPHGLVEMLVAPYSPTPN
jgi:L-asparaginase